MTNQQNEPSENVRRDDVAVVTTPETLDRVARSHDNPSKVVDPGSDLIDPDPAFSNEDTDRKPLDVVMVYAGANSGGQALNVCQGADGCSALVQNEYTNAHVAWHERTRA